MDKDNKNNLKEIYRTKKTKSPPINFRNKSNLTEKENKKQLRKVSFKDEVNCTENNKIINELSEINKNKASESYRKNQNINTYISFNPKKEIFNFANIDKYSTKNYSEMFFIKNNSSFRKVTKKRFSISLKDSPDKLKSIYLNLFIFENRCI